MITATKGPVRQHLVITGMQATRQRAVRARVLLTAAILLTIFAIFSVILHDSAVKTAADRTLDGMYSAAQRRATTAATETPVSINGQKSREIGLRWDGPTLAFDWTGQQRLVNEETMLGNLVVVPGDTRHRTLLVRNDGPTAAILDVWIDPREIIPEGSVNTALASDVELFWEVSGVQGSQSFANLLEKDTTALAQIKVDQAESIAVTVGTRMDESVERSRTMGVDSNILEFALGLAMTGDSDHHAEPLGITGGIHPGMLGVGAAVLFASGLLVLVWCRKRDNDEETVVRVQ